jgi:hypothetical protein
MSTISDRHTVVPFVAGKTVPLSNQRLAKVGYKTTAKTPAKLPSIAVSVPHISPSEVQENYQRLLPFIGTMLETAQDGIIRSLYESADGSMSSVSNEDISISQCINFMEAEANGTRLRKEHIEAWFDASVAENLTVMVAEKLGFTELDGEPGKTVAKHVRVYRDLLSMLAGGKTFLQPTQIRGCKNAIALATDESDIAVKLTARLNAMENKPTVEELLSLD